MLPPRSVAFLCAVLAAPFSAFSADLAEADARADKAAWCAALSKRLKSVNLPLCRQQDPKADARRSVNGRPLMTMDIRPHSDVSSPPVMPGEEAAVRPVRILLIGGMHGDELTSVSIVFRWLPFLKEPAARIHHWRVAPLVNPDGLFAASPQRMNANGVDLNRNFPTPDWSRDALPRWQSHARKNPRRFPGKSAMSEPETQWLCAEIDHFRPDIIVSVHAPYGVLDYDGKSPPPPPRLGRLILNRLGVHPGSLGNYGGVFKNIPVVTIELAHATMMPSPAEQRQILDDMLNWIQKRPVASGKPIKNPPGGVSSQSARKQLQGS